MTDDYYEDSHGNKIIGPYNKLKFVFSGFNSVVRIGENVNLNNSSFYIHDDVEIEIGDNCTIEGSVWNVKQHTSIQIGNECIIKNGAWAIDSSQIVLGNGCIISNCSWNANCAYIEIGKECKIWDNTWLAESQSYIKLGDGGRYLKGRMQIKACTKIIIGKDFYIGFRYYFGASKYTQILIGDYVMCSQNVVLRSNDGHSIFDVHTGKNINSTEEISKSRKIVIGNHVWVGTNAIILYNTEIGDGSIIGAGSLVKSRIPNNCIAVGIPARVIRKDIAWSYKNGADQLLEHEEPYFRLTE